MFLIRTAFWLSLVILLLPTGTDDRDNRAEAAAGVGAGDAFGAASVAVDDLSGFCARNPDACATGSAALRTFGQKAQHGVRLVYDYLAEDDEEDVPLDVHFPPRQATGNTLQPSDLETPWQGPESNG